MRTATKYSLVVLVTVLACTTNALPEETDGKITPAPPTPPHKGGKQPNTLKPVGQTVLNMVMWLDGDMAHTVQKFTNPVLCANKHTIDWNVLKFSFNFSVLVTINKKGKLHCESSGTACPCGILYFCSQKQIPDIKKFLDFYCCHINDKSTCPPQTCAEQLKLPFNMDELNKCMNDPVMEKQFADVWSGEGITKFNDDTLFPVFVVNGEFHETTTERLWQRFFGTSCEMYANGSKPHYCG